MSNQEPTNNQPEDETQQPAEESTESPVAGGLDLNVLDQAEEAVQNEGVVPPVTDHSEPAAPAAEAPEQIFEVAEATVPDQAQTYDPEAVPQEAPVGTSPAEGSEVTLGVGGIPQESGDESAVELPPVNEEPTAPATLEDQVAETNIPPVDEAPATEAAPEVPVEEVPDITGETTQTYAPEASAAEAEPVPDIGAAPEGELPSADVVEHLAEDVPVGAETASEEVSESYEEAPVASAEEVAPPEGADISEVVGAVQGPPSDSDDKFNDVTDDTPEVADEMPEVGSPARYLIADASREIANGVEEEDRYVGLEKEILEKLMVYAESGILEVADIPYNPESEAEAIIERDENGAYTISADFVDMLKGVDFDSWDEEFGIPMVYKRKAALAMATGQVMKRTNKVSISEIEKTVAFFTERWEHDKDVKDNLPSNGYFSKDGISKIANAAYNSINTAQQKASKRRAKGLLATGIIMFGVGVGTVYLTDYVMERQDEVDEYEDQQIELFRQKMNIQNNTVPGVVEDVVVLGQDLTPEDIMNRGYFLDGTLTEKLADGSGKEKQKALAVLHAKALRATSNRCADAYQIVIDNQDAKVRIYKVK